MLVALTQSGGFDLFAHRPMHLLTGKPGFAGAFANYVMVRLRQMKYKTQLRGQAMAAIWQVFIHGGHLPGSGLGSRFK